MRRLLILALVLPLSGGDAPATPSAAELLALLPADWPRPDAAPIAAEENGWSLFAEAAERFGRPWNEPQPLRDAINAVRGTRKQYPAEGEQARLLDASLEAKRPALDLLVTASLRPRCRKPATDPGTPRAQRPAMLPVEPLKALVIRMRRSVHRAERAALVDDATAVLRLLDALDRDGTDLIDRLLARAHLPLVLAPIIDAARRGLLRADDAAAIAALCPPRAETATEAKRWVAGVFVSSLASESADGPGWYRRRAELYVRSHAVIGAISEQRDETGFRPLTGADTAVAEVLELARAMPLVCDHAATLGAGVALVEDAIVRSRAGGTFVGALRDSPAARALRADAGGSGRFLAWPIVGAMTALMGDDLDAEREAGVPAWVADAKRVFSQGANPVGRMHLGMLTGMLPGHLEADVRMTAARVTQITAIALLAAERAAGALSQDLGELVTRGILRAPPTDPWTGDALRFDPQRRLVWSVGRDGIDGGGDAKTDQVVALDAASGER